MKQLKNVAIAGKDFTVTDEAYLELESWLERFRSRLSPASSAPEVMEEIEARVAELFAEASTAYNYVVDIELVRKVIGQLGMPDGSDPGLDGKDVPEAPVAHRFYRDPDGKKIGGVCSGLAVYFNIDVTLVRILAIVLMFFGSSGLWLYLILWLLAPMAVTPLQKCELRGIKPTAENLRKFSRTK